MASGAVSTGKRVAVLGAGPAGLWAALALAERGFSVDVLERHDAVGGNAGSFSIAGLQVDFGSHRLHPSTNPAILSRLRDLLGEDLLERPRHGRISLRNRWIHFPLRPLDLALRTPPGFALGVARDLVTRPFAKLRAATEESFASVLERNLGRTICRDFYFPYARKIWGLAPEEISALQAHRRISAGSIGKILRRLLPSRRRPGAAPSKGIFYYPRGGFGQISEKVCEAAKAAGARIHRAATVHRVRSSPDGGFEVSFETAKGPGMVFSDHVWSTIPASHLARMIEPPAPPAVVRSADGLSLRAMILVYLVLEQDRFTEYDAHYFPGLEVAFTRVSEPKAYADLREPRGRTVLCAEIPCSRDDAVWAMSSTELSELVMQGLARKGLEVTAPLLEVAVRRLAHAYPIYRGGFEADFERLDDWLSSQDGVLSFGRQGLFAHDNTHHAMFMAGSAVDCLSDDGRFHEEKWQQYRKVFATHVVED